MTWYISRKIRIKIINIPWLNRDPVRKFFISKLLKLLFNLTMPSLYAMEQLIDSIDYTGCQIPLWSIIYKVKVNKDLFRDM